jgi:hypothetical protein
VRGAAAATARQARPIRRLQTSPPHLPAQHRDLVPEHKDLNLLRHIATGEQHQHREQTAGQQVEERPDHEWRSRQPPGRLTRMDLQVTSRIRDFAPHKHGAAIWYGYGVFSHNLAKIGAVAS